MDTVCQRECLSSLMTEPCNRVRQDMTRLQPRSWVQGVWRDKAFAQQALWQFSDNIIITSLVMLEANQPNKAKVRRNWKSNLVDCRTMWIYVLRSSSSYFAAKALNELAPVAAGAAGAAVEAFQRKNMCGSDVSDGVKISIHCGYIICWESTAVI